VVKIFSDVELQCYENNELLFESDFKLPNTLIKRASNTIIKNNEQYLVRPDSFKANHPELRHFMRELLIDWMLEVSSEFDIRRETFYLACYYINLYLDKTRNVTKKDFQLVGTAALFLACKMEESNSPCLKVFIIATNNGYTKEEILEMERSISRTLSWNLNPITINSEMGE
jgi:hypothetical protein